MSSVVCKIVPYGSTEYLDAVVLRNEILRKPIGLVLSEEDLAQERGDTFFVATMNDRVVGCLILTPVNSLRAQMRQVAVEREHQRLGVGTQLVKAAELYAKEANISVVMLHARQDAILFYERQGYRLEGEEFQEVGLSHRIMLKSIV